MDGLDSARGADAALRIQQRLRRWKKWNPRIQMLDNEKTLMTKCSLPVPQRVRYARVPTQLISALDARAATLGSSRQGVLDAFVEELVVREAQAHADECDCGAVGRLKDLDIPAA